MANLFYQMKSSIEDTTSEHYRRREDFNQAKEHVLSYLEKGRLIDTASVFLKWLEKEHPEIKTVWDLNKDIAKEFLLAKHKINGGTCNGNTVNAYAQGLDKIAHLCNKKFGCSIEMAVDRRELPQDTKKKRSLIMNQDMLTSALNTMRDETQGKTCLEITKSMGLRASEFKNLEVRDFDFINMKLHIRGGKGGRSRDINLSPEAAETAKKWIEKHSLTENQRLFTVQKEAICALLNEGMKRSGYEEFEKTGLHSIRKMVANEFYFHQIKYYIDEKGLDFKNAEKEAICDVAEFLGHGQQRTVEKYVDRLRSLTDLEKGRV